MNDPRTKCRAWAALFGAGAAFASALGGCTGISVAPSCPNEVEVGESALLLANEINPGAIPTYRWEVIPASVGRVTDPTAPSTRFEAVAVGEAKVQLTATDGLYQVISFCNTRVVASTDNGNDNQGNTNDNTDNGNTNDNENGNANDNVDDGKDNENDNGGRPGLRKRIDD